MAERSLTIRIRVDDRAKQVEDAILAKLRKGLAQLPDDPRPTMEIGRAETGSVEVEPDGE